MKIIQQDCEDTADQLTTQKNEFDILNDIIQECGEDIILDGLHKWYEILAKKLFGGADAGMFYCPYIPPQ